MKSNQRWIPAILAVLLLAGLAGCGSKKPEVSALTTEEQQTVPPVETEEDTRELEAKDVLGERDLGEETITFFARTGGNMWDVKSLYADEILSEAINDAVYSRNEKLSQDFHFNVKIEPSGATSYSQRLTNTILGNAYGFDVVTACGYDMAELAVNGVLRDLTQVDGLNLDRSWWNTTLNSQLSVGNALFYLSGDIICEDNMAVRCIFFNKRLADAVDCSPDDLYQMAKDRTWTFEEMFSLAEKAYLDSDETFGTSSGDRLGFVAQKVVAGYVLMTAAGVRLTSKDESDVPTLNSPLPDTVFSDITAYFAKDGVLIASDALTPYKNGRALFMTEVLGTAAKVRDWDVETGILPLPLYNSEQTVYYHFADGNCLNLLALPTGNGKRLNDVVFMMEAMCIESTSTLNPAFYDTCLRGRYSNDPESWDMLDIILNSYFIEDANLYKRAWGSLQDDIVSAMAEGQSVTTVMERYSTSLPVLISETVEKLGRIANAQRK